MRLLLLIPCYNEEDNVVGVITSARNELERMGAQPVESSGAEADLQYRILVLDDGSGDRTAEVARPHARVVSLPVNSGVETALHTGYLYAVREGFDAVMHLDGDGQHPARFIPDLLREHRETGCDIILTTRFTEREGFQSTRLRRLGKDLIRWVTRALHRVEVTDPTSGFKLIAGEPMRKFAEGSPLDYSEPVSLSLIVSHGYPFREIPVSMNPRVHGESYLAGLSSLAYMIRVTLRLFSRVTTS